MFMSENNKPVIYTGCPHALGRTMLMVLTLLCLLTSHAMATVSVYTQHPWEEMNLYSLDQMAAGTSPIKIDGDISDWKPDAFYVMYNLDALKDQFAMRIAFAYDTKGVYFAARVSDHNPMLNYTDAKINPKDGWDGDSIQLRLTAIPSPVNRDKSDNIAMITLWYQTDKKEPALHIMYGCDAHSQLVLTGSQSNLHFRSTKEGYVVEGFLPYEILHQDSPTPGSTWRLQTQANFSDEAGKSVHVVYDCFVKQVSFFRDPRGWGRGLFVKPEQMTQKLAEQVKEQASKHDQDTDKGMAIAFTYDNPADGFVSLAVRNEAHQIVRTLRMKQSQAKGQGHDTWDGMNDNGQPVAPGQYTIDGISHTGIQSKFIASVHNSGNPSWQGVDSSSQWGGDHGPAIDVTTDDKGNSYLIWTNDEKGTALIKVDSQGQKIWGSNSSWGEISRDGVCAVAYANNQVFLGKSSIKAGLLAYNATTGERENFPTGKGIFIISENFKDKLNTPLPDDCNDPPTNLTDLLVAHGNLYAALHKENLIRVYRLDTFELVNTITVPRPLSLEWDEKTQSLQCISRNNLTAIKDPLSKQPIIHTIVSGLDQPFGLVVDKAGVTWVGLRGKTQQVIGFDAQGKKTGSIGKLGGRPWVGKFEPQGMLQPAGLAIDQAGHLWVMEEDNLPRRQSLWDMKTGRLVRDFFGPSAYSPMMAPDLQDPQNVFIHNMRFVVDYDTGKVTPAATVYRKDYLPNTPPGTEYRYLFMGQTFEIATYQGKKFAYDGHGGVYAYTDGVFKPLLHIGHAFNSLPGLDEKSQGGRGMSRGYAAVWRDTNGDHQFSQDEVQLIQGLSLLPNIAQFGGTFFPGARFIAGRRIFQPQGLDQYGAPIYPDPKDAPLILTGDGPMSKIPVWLDVWPSLKNDWQSYYAIAARKGSATYGDNITDGIYKFTPDGQILWRYAPVGIGFGLKKNIAKTGEIFGALRIAGLIDTPKEQGGEIIGIGCYRGYFGFLTEDGLYIDLFGTDAGYGPKADYNTLFIENFSGYFFRNSQNHKVYLFTGATDGRIVELSGWKNIRRIQPVGITVTPQQHTEALARLASPKLIETAQGPLQVAQKNLQGSNWPKPARIAIDGKRHANVSLMYDKTNLYARFVVHAPVTWTNASKDWHYDFKGGNAVDIQLGDPRPIASGSKNKFLPGDVRVLVAPAPEAHREQRGQRVGLANEVHVTAHWKMVPDGLKKDPFTFVSPVASEIFDRVEQLKEMVVQALPSSEGYSVEVTLSWSALHREPPSPGQKLSGDVGVLLGDNSGSRTILRRYLFNKDTNIVDDVPSESRIKTSAWGELVFE